MNNKFKGLYNTEGTTFLSDRTEPIHYYEPTIKTAKIQNHTYSINFDKTELYKEIEKLQQELQRKDNIINELKECLKKEYNYCDKHIDPAFGTGMGVAKRMLDRIKELENGNK